MGNTTSRSKKKDNTINAVNTINVAAEIRTMGNETSCFKKVDNNINAGDNNINLVLPAEMLDRVFQYLCLQDLKKIVQVCRRWREVGEAPGLWARDYIRVNSTNLALIPKMLESRRYQTVKRLDVCVFWVELTDSRLEKLFRAVVGHQRLKVLTFTYAKLKQMSSVELQLLIQASTRLEELNLFGTYLTPPQITQLCTAQKEYSSLKKLNLGFNDLSSVKLDVISQIAKQLQVMNLAGTSLTHMQVTTILNIIGEGCNLRELNLSLNMKTLELVDEELLAKGVAQLEDVDLRKSCLTSYQINALLAAIGKGTKLKRLILKHINLSSSRPILLAKAVVKLEEVDLSGSSLSHDQIVSLCKALGEGSRLKRLDMSWNSLISSVEPMLVARAFIHLEELTLFDAGLTNRHGEAIFNAMGGPSHLRRLDIQQNNLSSVDPEAIAVAVNKLENADMRSCSMTEEQVTSILQHCLEETALKELNVWENDVKVAEHLGTRARQVIPKLLVQLHRTV